MSLTGPSQAPAGDDTTAAADIQAGPGAAVYAPGHLYAYETERHWPTPHKTQQVVIVTEVDGDGRARGFALGYRDDAAEFAPGQLVALADAPPPEKT